MLTKITKTPMIKTLFGVILINLVSFLTGCTAPVIWEEEATSLRSPWETGVSLAEPKKLDQLQYKTAGPAEPYIIGANDVLSVTVWGRVDLGSQFPSESDSRRKVSIVKGDGTITLPLLSKVNVAGLSLGSARDVISKKYINAIGESLVDVEIIHHRSQSVQVFGALARPGVYFLSNNLTTLGDIISKVGGFTEKANQAGGIFVRDGQEYPLDLNGSQFIRSKASQLVLRAGDRVFFPAIGGQIFYVFGEVSRQGVYAIPDKGVTLLEALARAGGPVALNADMDKIFLLRSGNEGSTDIYRANMKDVLSRADIPIRAGDRIYIPPTGLAVWNRTWTQILPFVNAGGMTSYFYRNIDEINQQ